MSERFYIWENEIPYNSNKSKLDDLIIGDYSSTIVLSFKYLSAVFKNIEIKDSSVFDTYHYNKQIKTGKVSENYNDKPYIEAYLVDNPKGSLIILPGGAFCEINMEGGEGKVIAENLNKKGYSAFVLRYRLQPYQAPVFFLDLFRAIKYVRFNYKKFNIDPNNLGVLGFSAGGYIGSYLTDILKNIEYDFPASNDEIDKENGFPDYLALLYPLVSYKNSPNTVSLLDRKGFFSNQYREELINKYSIYENLNTKSCPHFVCYGSKEQLKFIHEYCLKHKSLGTEIKEIVVKGASHGFSANGLYLNNWIDELILWIDNLSK